MGPRPLPTRGADGADAVTEGNTLGTALRLARETAVQSGRPICLDSSALIAYLSNEPHARHVAPLVEDALLPLSISTVALAETVVRRALRGRDAVERVVDAIRQIPGLILVPVEESVAIETAIVRAETKLQLPDAIVVATARLGDAVAIVGNDRRWQRRSLGVPFICLDDLD